MESTLNGKDIFSVLENSFEYSATPSNWKEMKTKFNEMNLIECERLFEGSIFYKRCILKCTDTNEEISLDVTYVLDGYVVLLEPHKNSDVEMLAINLYEKPENPFKEERFLALKN
ncbi:MAG: hypothetical protein N4A44_03270 [Alphaproteobacteria bacterium]|nr:hypothetical protein [Alphaproteobacteria bacterium]